MNVGIFFDDQIFTSEYYLEYLCGRLMNMQIVYTRAAAMQLSCVACLKCPPQLSVVPKSLSSRKFVTNIAESTEGEFLKHYHLSGKGKRNYVELLTDTGFTLKTDVPKSMGGQNLAAQPVETLLAALMGCTQATAVYVGRHMQPERVLVDWIEFDISACRDERGALQLPIEQTPVVSANLQTISGSIKIHAKNPLSSQQLEFLKHQTEIRCPVASLLIAGGCHLDIHWESA